jgi:hypothetical protein
MSLNIDWDAVQDHDRALHPDEHTPGDWRVLLTEKAITAAMEREEARIAEADACIERVGASAVLEALRRRGCISRDW